MKRYFVNHADGLTRDSAFPEIVDHLLEAKLISGPDDRTNVTVRAWSGEVVKRKFLHLFKRRDEAEAFLTRLKATPDDRRWAIFEVDVVGPVSLILHVDELDLPDWPKVREIQASDYVDHLGDEALQIRVVLEPRSDGDIYPYEHLKPIYRLIQDTLREEGITLFPYIAFEIAEDPILQPSVGGG